MKGIKMKIIINFLMSITLVGILSSCGQTSVDLGTENYEPKIVIEAYLYPETKVENIKITRNFPVNTIIDKETMAINDAIVKITDLNGNIEYKLDFDPVKKSYFYNGSDLVIGYNKSYRLNVQAAVAGKQLSAESETTVPNKGFKINRASSILGSLKYRQRDAAGLLIEPKIVFNQSLGIDLYAYGLTALDAAKNQYIYENPFFTEDDTLKFEDHINNQKYRSNWIFNMNEVGQTAEIQISWHDTWFYGKYQIILYAADRNFKDYYVTHADVMEMDGNLHEPKFHIKGDGIGVFGSAIADTVYFEIIR
jgi:hypothetical protein